MLLTISEKVRGPYFADSWNRRCCRWQPLLQCLTAFWRAPSTVLYQRISHQSVQGRMHDVSVAWGFILNGAQTFWKNKHVYWLGFNGVVNMISMV